MKNLREKIEHINLPYGDLNDFKKFVPKLSNNQLCIITIPTPKQEILAEFIRSTQNNFKILCLGAAINMASGDEKTFTRIFRKIFIAETIWRLQFETFRRLNRLISSFSSYLRGKRKKIYEKLEFKNK